MDSDSEQPGQTCPLVMLAGTMALMTRYADPNPARSLHGTIEIHPLLAQKIVSNLLFLQQHPALPEQLGRVMAQAHAQWASIVAAGGVPGPARAGGDCCALVRH